ncbi:hypothetical protein ACHAPU_005514 [Fusarium lateritium]
MVQNAPDNYVPQYAKQDEWEDQELQKFAIEFYRISDKPEENQRWVDSFTEDAQVQIGADKAQGSKDLAEFRTRMWAHIKERRHNVHKVFPGRFADSKSSEAMLLGETDGSRRLLGRRMQLSGRWMGSGSSHPTEFGYKLKGIFYEQDAAEQDEQK